ncbi:hypothetical protein HN419_03900 [Candidatus Woesearchaeota archaeon]|jgi:hypothetical protein|nr:hypothetical protein [Candidatus Woesearchaeota archaeon]MBT3537978.1 hypothetical protein [Candidatus Woesearchaeota archaeon]MBT4697333.1 hypothetical protein [Candidatus Woesearchaeota archaeon]MBT4717053.1 hypothetical protein [Candidatus Woesearchaeota archaeon]MBT7105647.1 hypothetical protein [Candidatus Woesearchaeota archaeon]
MARIRKNIFEELEKVKKLVEVHFPEIEIRELCKLLGKIGTYHYNKKKIMLLGKDKLVYNTLIENSYNPYTVYRWALLKRVPEDIRFQLRNHNLSQKKASKLFFERRHETETSLQLSIKQLGLQLVRGM